MLVIFFTQFRYLTVLFSTTLNQSGPGFNGSEGVLHIPQSSKTAALQSDYLVSKSGHSLGDSYPSIGMQSVSFTAPADWTYIISNFWKFVIS